MARTLPCIANELDKSSQEYYGNVIEVELQIYENELERRFNNLDEPTFEGLCNLCICLYK